MFGNGVPDILPHRLGPHGPSFLYRFYTSHCPVRGELHHGPLRLLVRVALVAFCLGLSCGLCWARFSKAAFPRLAARARRGPSVFWLVPREPVRMPVRIDGTRQTAPVWTISTYKLKRPSVSALFLATFFAPPPANNEEDPPAPLRPPPLCAGDGDGVGLVPFRLAPPVPVPGLPEPPPLYELRSCELPTLPKPVLRAAAAPEPPAMRAASAAAAGVRLPICFRIIDEPRDRAEAAPDDEDDDTALDEDARCLYGEGEGEGDARGVLDSPLRRSLAARSDSCAGALF